MSIVYYYCESDRHFSRGDLSESQQAPIALHQLRLMKYNQTGKILAYVYGLCSDCGNLQTSPISLAALWTI